MTHPLHLTLFGSPQVRLGQVPFSGFTIGKTQALFFYLAMQPGTVRRDLLANLLWRDMVDSQSRHNLRTTLHGLRGSLGSYLIATRTEVGFNREQPYWLDIEKFRERLASQQGKTPLTALEEAIQLYKGDFLDGFHVRDAPGFDEWMLIEREQLREQAIWAMDSAIEQYVERDEYERGLTISERLLVVEPWRERAHQQRMMLLASSGQRSSALFQFEQCQRILDEEFAIGPSSETVALYERIKAGEYDQRSGGQDDKTITVERPSSPSASPAPVSAPDPYATLSRLEPLPDQKLFGVAKLQSQLRECVLASDRLWLIALEGIGGIGKTTLAHDVTRQLVGGERFHDIAWVSAKQEEFVPDAGLRSVDRPALDATMLIDTLLEQLEERPSPATTFQAKQAALLRLFKERPYLVVVDNLETVADYKALLPVLRQFANPTKFLITSRFSLRAHTDVFCINLSELNRTDALAFIQYQASMRGIQPLIQAKQGQLDAIYAVVGGNPLALKLVIGQASFLPLSQVLDSLEAAQGQEIDELYTYIYWQAWNLLDEVARILFLTMPVVPNGTFEQLLAISRLKIDQLRQAIPQLIALSLIQVSGSLEKRVYHLHSLTETFLMNEVLKWQPNP